MKDIYYISVIMIGNMICLQIFMLVFNFLVSVMTLWSPLHNYTNKVCKDIL
ncbi:hypothetical protein EDWATA_00987 [Edwardsiella tarda ATCC 23685]|uniref:Uncharacterized protein n=1 Tax=Edwardsiella tarda ATCC 23685 TaxID=500638 RepID=D4F2N6_EDWTA|nr:hypothetical protein EDWATA_00987 [Edwardsiella tarda ATCC 23685]